MVTISRTAHGIMATLEDMGYVGRDPKGGLGLLPDLLLDVAEAVDPGESRTLTLVPMTSGLERRHVTLECGQDGTLRVSEEGYL